MNDNEPDIGPLAALLWAILILTASACTVTLAIAATVWVIRQMF